jgi:hypothetical protein
MTTLNRLFSPLRNAAAAFFKHDLAVRREGAQVRLVLEERPAEGRAKESRVEQSQRKEKEELAQMRAELAALLNELPETRLTLRHLVFVEQALAKKGLRALHKVPLDVLQRALEQLEGLVTNWSPVGLANLRSKMAVAVLDREHMPVDAEADAYRTAAVLDHVPERPRADASPERSDDDALAAAYAALGSLAPDTLAPVPVEMQGELGSSSAKTLERPPARSSGKAPEIDLRVLQD